jgi:antitoxin YefM
MDMSSSEHLPLADVKNRLSEVVETLEREHGRVVVTKHGRPAAVMLSIEDLESLEETLEIMSNPALLKAVREGQRDLAAGRTSPLSREEALARVPKRDA